MPRSGHNGWHSVVDTRETAGRGRGSGRAGGRGRTLNKRRLLMTLIAATLALLFLGARQSPRPEWQGFVSVRGLQVFSPPIYRHLGPRPASPPAPLGSLV